MRYYLAAILILAVILVVVGAEASTPVITKNFENSVAEGKLSGYEFSRCAANVNATNSEKIVSDNLTDSYPWRDSAETFKVVSSDNSEDGTIEVIYLDENWDMQTVDIGLDGTAPVESTVSAIRIIQAKVIDGGSYDTNTGDVYIYGDTTVGDDGVPDDLDEVLCKIPAEEGISHMAIFSIPRGKVGIITRLFIYTHVDSNAENVTMKIYTQIPIDGNRIKYMAESVTVGRSLGVVGEAKMGLPEKSDVWLTCESQDASSPMTVGFLVYIRDE